MERPNYGLALSSSGDFQVINTWFPPGVQDCWSTVREESFLFLVAPAERIDEILNIHYQTEANYMKDRRMFMRVFPHKYRDAILNYAKRK